MNLIDFSTNNRIKRFDLSVELLAQLIQLPVGARIERMHISNRASGAISLVISHSSFDEVDWGAWLPELTPVGRWENGHMVIEWSIEPNRGGA